MKTGKIKYQIYKQSELYLNSFFCNEIDDACFIPEHVLILIYSGELELIEGKKKTLAKKGEYVFIKRSNFPILKKKNNKNEKFCSVCMGFSRSFLLRFFRQFKNKTDFLRKQKFDANFVKLPQNPYLQSLYISMIPYFEWKVKPCKEILELKLTEAVYCLLITDDRLYSCLFDFKTFGKTDIMDFLNKNYMYDMTVDEMAASTGRSTSTFNRHFRKLSDITPHAWIVQKRLEEAYIRLQNGEDINEVYQDTGFKNIKQFKDIFRKKYGFCPESIIK